MVLMTAAFAMFLHACLQTVTTVLILAFLLVGGYYVRNIPVWIGWIRYISFIYWGYNMAIKMQFR